MKEFDDLLIEWLNIPDAGSGPSVVADQMVALITRLHSEELIDWVESLEKAPSHKEVLGSIMGMTHGLIEVLGAALKSERRVVRNLED